MKKLFRALLIPAAFLILTFSNCSQFTPGGLDPKNYKSDNGKPYDGMTNAYYRFIPSYSCSGSPSPFQIASLNGDTVALFSNDPNQCAVNSDTISISQVDISPFQTEYISIKDALFEQHSQSPMGIPNNLAEILCRDDFQNPKFEVLSHYDISRNQAVTRIYFANSQKNIADFSVSRILSAGSVQYVSDQISFNVDLSKPAEATRKFSGTIVATNLKDLSPQKITCVTGGALDTSNWTLTEVTPMDATNFKIFENGNLLIVSAITPPPAMQYYFNFRNLFSLTPDGVSFNLNTKYFGPNSSFQSYWDLDFENAIVFSTSSDYDAFNSNYFYDATNGNITKLTNLKYDPSLGRNQPNEAYILDGVKVLSNNHLIYDIFTYGASSSNETYRALRDFNLTTKQYVDFAPQMRGVTLRRSSKVIWIDYTSPPDALTYNLYDSQTQTSKAFSISTPNCNGTGWPIDSFENEMSFATMINCNGGDENDLVFVSLIDQSYKVIGKNKGILWTSSDKKWLLLGDIIPKTTTDGQITNVLSAQNSVVYSIEAQQYWPAPMDPQFGIYSGPNSGVPYTSFSLDFIGQPKIAIAGNKYLYGFSGDLNSPTLNQVNLTNGKITPVCSNALGLKLFVSNFSVKNVSSPDAYLFSYDSALHVYRFYRISPDGTCSRLNEFPSKYASIVDFTTTEIGFAITTNAGNLQPSVEAIFVPINGQPPLRLNDQMRGSHLQISKDRKKIYLNIPDAKGNWPLFTFKL